MSFSISNSYDNNLITLFNGKTDSEPVQSIVYITFLRSVGAQFESGRTYRRRIVGELKV